MLAPAAAPTWRRARCAAPAAPAARPAAGGLPRRWRQTSRAAGGDGPGPSSSSSGEAAAAAGAAGAPQPAASAAGAPGAPAAQAAAAAPAAAAVAAAPPDAAAAEPRRPPDPSACPSCSGSGRVACKECGGSGRLQRGGYHKRNRVDLSRILDSKWTAMETTLGWRHFRVTQMRKAGRAASFVLLQASCDAGSQLWINAASLKDRRRWAAGWLQMSEILGQAEGAVGGGQECRSCSGLGVKMCAPCEGTGRVRVVVIS